jgi:hypothetical protein
MLTAMVKACRRQDPDSAFFRKDDRTVGTALVLMPRSIQTGFER